MSTINRLSSVDVLQPSDQIPVWDSSNGDTRKASMSTLLAFVESYFADPDYSTRIVAPNTDYFTVDIGNTGDSIWMIVNPVLNFTTGAITLPSTAYAVNDQEITVVFTAAVVNFSITSSGATVLGAPATINGYDSFRVRYNSAQQTWYTLDTTGDGSGIGTSSIVRQDFTGDGTTTTFTLTTAPSSLGNELQIFIDGVYQERAGYVVTGSNVVFSEAPPSLSTIEVLGWSVNIGTETSANLVSYTPAGTGAVVTTVQAKLRDSVSVSDFGAVGDGATDDTAAIQAAIAATSNSTVVLPVSTGNYNIDTALTGTTGVTFISTGEQVISGTGVALTVASGPINLIYYKGGAQVFSDGSNAPNKITTSPRGLVVLNETTNTSSAINCVPNEIPAGTNKAYSNVRVWAQDIISSPTGSRQALGMETHYDTDETMRSRSSTRSEGSPALKHLDYYWQFNGNNCFYLGTARAGIGSSAVSMGWFPGATSFKTDFSPTTGLTTYWASSYAYSIGDEVALSACDYVYLECTSAGTSNASTEPNTTGYPIGSTGLSDGTVTWEVHSRLQESGGDAIPAMWIDQNGNTGFSTYNPTEKYYFADVVKFATTVKFAGLKESSVSASVTAAGVSSLNDATQLISEINQVSTVAVDSGVRLPSAAPGIKVYIKNDGANTLKIWPFNGDDLGLGTNTNTTLAVGASAEFVCYSSNDWFSLV